MSPRTEKGAGWAGPASLRAWALILADNVHLRIGNRPVVMGRKNALAELGKLIKRSSEFGTSYKEVFRSSGTLIVESNIRLAKADDFATIPCVMISRSENGLFADLRLYVDLSGFRC